MTTRNFAIGYKPNTPLTTTCNTFPTIPFNHLFRQLSIKPKILPNTITTTTLHHPPHTACGPIFYDRVDDVCCAGTVFSKRAWYSCCQSQYLPDALYACCGTPNRPILLEKGQRFFPNPNARVVSTEAPGYIKGGEVNARPRV